MENDKKSVASGVLSPFQTTQEPEGDVLIQEPEGDVLIQEPEGDVLILKQEDDVLTLKQEDDVLTLKQEDDVLTLKQEGDVLTLKQDDDVLTLKQEGDVLSLKQEGDVLTQPDHEDGASTASPPTSTSKASKRKWPPLKICQRNSKQLMLDINSSSSTSSLAPGPVLYCLDPDFCSVHTVFEVPLNKPSPLISRSPNMSTPRENSPHISITTAEQKPSTHPMTQETVTTEKILNGEPCPGSVKGDGSLSTPCPEPPVLERQTEVGGSPCSETDHSANGMAEVCTLACCSASASSPLNFANIPIRQEVMDHDNDFPAFLNPSDLWPLLEDTEQADLQRLVPYRSHLSAFSLQTPTSSPVPYRSEPLWAFPPPPNPLLQGVPGGQEDQQAIGSSSASIGSTVEDDVLPWTSFAVSYPAVDTQIGLQPVLVPLTTAPQVFNVSPSQATSSLQLSSDDIFFRGKDGKIDLMEVFRRNSHRIYEILFKFGGMVGSNDRGSVGPPFPNPPTLKLPHKKLFTDFWEQSLAKHFEGHEDKVPRLDSQGSNHDVPYLLGQVLRHGLLLCGYWPVAMSPACTVKIISGDMCSSDILLQSLSKVMYPFEAQALEDLRDSAVAALDHSTQAALDHSTQAARSHEKKMERFLAVRGGQRVGHVVDTYGGSNCKVPTAPEEVEAFIMDLASFYLYYKPFWILREIRRGFLAVTEHTWGGQDYLNSLTERHVLELYEALVPTPQTLIPRLVFTFPSGEQVRSRHRKTRQYLECSLLRLSPRDLRTLMVRWSWADCLLDARYYVSVASSLGSASAGTDADILPYFWSPENLLVLPATPSNSFSAFHNVIRSLLA